MRSSGPFFRGVVCVLLVCAAVAGQVPQRGRALPLNRFPVSRSTGTDPQGYFRMATAIGDDYFDGKDSVERVRRHMQIAKAVGARYLRCAFSWNGIEPAPGEYKFGFWDQLVEETTRAGIELIPYVAYTPKWAAREQRDFWRQPPRNPALFAEFMRALVTRYRGKIRSWELWNEPDNQEYWTGTADEFAAMIVAAAPAVRAADPGAVLVLGGMTRAPGSFVDALIKRYDIDRYVDVLAMHAYPESWEEERAETAFQQWIPQMHSAAAASGDDVWLNEMGYADYRFTPNHASAWGTDTYYAYEHTRRYAADFLLKSFVMTLASGQVSVAGWYRIDDFREDDRRMPADKVHDHLGITDITGKRKPAFFAFRFFNELFDQPARSLDSAAPTRSQQKSQAVVHEFQRKDGAIIVAAWLRSSEYRELAVHSGMIADNRRERVSVPLPCTASTVDTFSAIGQRLSHRHPRTRDLADVPLSGDRVYVAEAHCAAQQ